LRSLSIAVVAVIVQRVRRCCGLPIGPPLQRPFAEPAAGPLWFDAHGIARAAALAG
jgi:hypothetical protein